MKDKFMILMLAAFAGAAMNAAAATVTINAGDVDSLFTAMTNGTKDIVLKPGVYDLTGRDIFSPKGVWGGTITDKSAAVNEMKSDVAISKPVDAVSHRVKKGVKYLLFDAERLRVHKRGEVLKLLQMKQFLAHSKALHPPKVVGTESGSVLPSSRAKFVSCG